MSATTTELGCPGHFCASDSCQWRRHTQVGTAYRVSTVGDYYPLRDGKRRTVGSGEDDYFETMVFPTDGSVEKSNDGCGCVSIADLAHLEQVRYATAGEAQAGHERLVEKYKARAGQRPKRPLSGKEWLEKLRRAEGRT